MSGPAIVMYALCLVGSELGDWKSQVKEDGDEDAGG